MSAPKIVVVAGPTATGKTRLGILLAQALDGEIVSADSMQVYRRMDVGTAKATPEERAAARHHMLDVAEPWENYSVSRYVEEASACCGDILSRGKLPIVVGGTGLYIDSLLAGRDFAGRSRATRACVPRFPRAGTPRAARPCSRSCAPSIPSARRSCTPRTSAASCAPSRSTVSPARR